MWKQTARAIILLDLIGSDSKHKHIVVKDSKSKEDSQYRLIQNLVSGGKIAPILSRENVLLVMIKCLKSQHINLNLKHQEYQNGKQMVSATVLTRTTIVSKYTVITSTILLIWTSIKRQKSKLFKTNKNKYSVQLWSI